MVRKAWAFAFTLLLSAGATAVSAGQKGELPAYLRALDGVTKAQHIVSENESGPVLDNGDLGEIQAPINNPNVRRDAEYGDTIVVGYTWYDYQANGTIGKMIAKDSFGGVHFCLMKGFTQDPLGQRRVVYNYLQASNDPNPGALICPAEEANFVDNADRGGYTNLALLPADQRAVVFHHVVHPPDHAANYTGTSVAVDFDHGFGAFSQYYPNPFPNVNMIWPKGAVSRNNIIHTVSTESPPENSGQSWQRVGYWRGTAQGPQEDPYSDWGFNDLPINIDTAGTISTNVCASVTSNRVAMAWFHPRANVFDPTWSQYGGLWQRNNDIRYVISENGRDFDFQRGVKSMTKINPPIPALAEMDLNEAYGDTFRPYCDIDMQFDPWGNDNLYATFAAQGLWEEPYEDYQADGDSLPCDNTGTILNYHNGGEDILWFWNMERDTITMIANGWYPNLSWKGDGWGSRVGAWRLNADRGSIAFNPETPGTIYVVWVSFPQIMDYNPDFDWNLGFDAQEAQPFDYFGNSADTSADGYIGAEVMVSVSTDYGITWREPINVTQTYWDGDVAPEPGQMRSEAWTSVAYLADDTLHIAYVQDLDAGGVIQTPAEGAPTNSPFVYQRIAISDLPMNEPVQLPREGFMFHNYPDYIPLIESVTRTQAAPVPNNPVQIRSTIIGAGGSPITGAVLTYRVNGGDPANINMARVEGDIWGCNIPQQSDGATVWYMVTATNDVGATNIYPKNNSWLGYYVRPAGGLTIHDVQYRPEADGDKPWGDDYSFYKGYEVTVSGVVTTPAEFNGAYDGFAIQDGAGMWSGVIVRSNTEVAIGDRVTVTGTVFERDTVDLVKWQYATYIQATNVQIAEHGVALPAPFEIDSVAQMTFGGGCEGLEAVLVNYQGAFVDELTGNQGAARTYWPITDGSDRGYVSVIGLTPDQVADLGIRDWVQGTGIEHITGIFTENFGDYSIAIRVIEDVGKTGVEKPIEPNPVKFSMNAAYPNPFNAFTTIGFTMPQAGFGKLGLYDLQGRLVANVVEGTYQAGTHQFMLDASEMSTGVYVLKFEALGKTATQKVVLMK